MSNTSRNLLIDGNNLLHRAYAIFVTNRSDDPMISPSGYPTGLIYGFLSMLSDWVLSVSRPSRMDVFFDGTPKRRLSLDPSYKLKEEGDKARPGSEPFEIRLCDGYVARNELDVLTHLFLLMGSDVYYHPDEEADDLIASYVNSRPYDYHIIVSSDRDYYQLLADSDRIVIYRPGSTGDRFVDAEKSVIDMERKFKVAIQPSEILMFKALTGDNSDHIPGIPRLRKKVAATVCGCSNFDQLLETGLPGFSKIEREKIESSRDRISLNLQLVRLYRNLDLSSSRIAGTPDHRTALKILIEDLGITTVSPSSFCFKEEHKVRYGGTSSYEFLPDFLKDV